jgi:hypothetical protein
MKYTIYRRSFIYEKYGNAVIGTTHPEIFMCVSSKKKVASILSTSAYYVAYLINKGWAWSDKYYEYKVVANG